MLSKKRAEMLRQEGVYIFNISKKRAEMLSKERDQQSSTLLSDGIIGETIGDDAIDISDVVAMTMVLTPVSDLGTSPDTIAENSPRAEGKYATKVKADKQKQNKCCIMM